MLEKELKRQQNAEMKLYIVIIVSKREWKLERINLRLTLYSAFWREFHRIFSSRFVRNSPLAAAAHIFYSSLLLYPSSSLNMEWEKMMDAQSGTMDDYLNSLFYIFSIILCNLYFKLSSLPSLKPHAKQSWKWLKTCSACDRFQQIQIFAPFAGFGKRRTETKNSSEKM